MRSIEEILQQARPVLPVLVLEQPELALPLTQALYRGGLRVVEVTLRTSLALDAVRLLREQMPDLVVGVGTVVEAGQFEQARAAGAQFAVSPGFTPKLAEAACKSEMPYLPAVMTASEVLQAMEHGFRTLKLYPASLEGSRQLLESFTGPFADLRFCPTGGINAGNLNSFLGLPNVVCCGGSWLAPESLVREQNWEQVTRLAQQARALAGGEQ